MVSSSSKNAKRNKRRRSNSSRIGDCTVADLFRFQDQLEFVFGIVYLIASVVHFNLDLIRKCCPKNPPEATLEAIEAYKADVKHLCQQFSTTYKRVLFFYIHTFFFIISTLSLSQKVEMPIGQEHQLDFCLTTRPQRWLKNGQSL